MVANGENLNGRSEDSVDDAAAIPRPPDIEQDMKEMERRKRVKMIIESQIFKEELERIIESQLNEGYFPSTLSALQQVTELIAPKSGGSNAPSQSMPVNDIRGVDALKYDMSEKLLRCKLASVYRLVDLYGWSQLIYNHISVRINQEDEHFLINAFGLQYPEITASSLIKVDMQGNTIDPGSTNFSFNRAGFILHSAIHAARPDIKAIIHIHYPACVAVSSVKHGLLCICQEAAIIGDVSYHDYKGLAISPDQRNSVANDLGPVNKVLILKNHGVLTCGETLEEALYYLQNVVKACETQVKLEPIKPGMLHEMSAESRQQVRSIITNFGASVQGKPGSEKEAKSTSNNPQLKKWKIWDLEFEAQMRMLDNAVSVTFFFSCCLLETGSERERVINCGCVFFFLTFRDIELVTFIVSLCCVCHINDPIETARTSRTLPVRQLHKIISQKIPSSKIG
jgi:adducin